MSKIPSVHRDELGVRRGAGGWGWRVRGWEGEMKGGTRRFGVGVGWEGQGAGRVGASSLATGGNWSQDEALGPGFPLKTDPNRDKAGMRTACWSPRR